MKKSIKRIAVMIFTTGIILSSTFTSLAGWEQSEAGWKYKDDGKGVYLSNGWYWLDGNNDGISESYYLDSAGIMAVNTTIEGYTVDINGAWTVDNIVQTKTVSGTGGQTNNNYNAGHQKQSGIPSLDDISSGTSSNMDNSDVQAGDSTGLPPMQSGTGDNRRPVSIGNVGSMDWSGSCGDSTGLPPLN